MIKIKIGIILFVIFACLVVPVLVAQAQGGGVIPLEIGIGGDDSVTGIVDYIDLIYKFATGIVGGLAVVMIIIGGVQYSAAAGNQKAIGSAKETITSAIVGLVVVGLAYLILGIFGNQFVVLVEPNIPPPKESTSKTRSCPEGQKYFEEKEGCDPYCQAKYNRTCSPLPIGGGDTGYCCMEESVDPENDKCQETCQKLEWGLCLKEGPCWQVRDPKWCKATGIPEAKIINNDPRFPSVGPATYDAKRCAADFGAWSSKCRAENCGVAELKYLTNGNFYCCTAAAKSH